MAKWIMSRPEKHANPGELQVARWLKSLPDDWLVRWGYYYKDKNLHREGDFLVLGPRGGLLVIEVKGGKLLHHAGSGNWVADGKPATGNPVDQLQAQWGAVLRRLQRAAREAQSSLDLYVDKVLALPDVEIGEQDESHQGIEWDLIADRNDLQWFESWWRRRFRDRPVGDGARTLFMDTFGPTARPAEVRHFVHHSEEIFRRQCLANFEMLDMLEANRQLLVEGGAGTGKTWHAMVKAVRLARGGGGRRVLLLCYNLALAGEIRKVVDCNPPLGDGGIDVMAWEELARSLIEEAGLKWSPPPAEAPREHVARFYDMQVPELMAQAIDRLEAGAVLPRWDALVVDEAQDHDTGGTANWWAMYVRLLKQGSRSRVALFLDPAQRPEFRRGEFVTGDLIATLDHPVRVRLPKPLRYTGPIADYLKSLKGRGVDRLVAGLGGTDGLPPGPEVVQIRVDSASSAVECVGRIIEDWCRDGYCRPWDVLLVHRRRTLKGSCLEGVPELAGARLVPHEAVPPSKAGDKVLRHVSANRAKGLDALAVVVVDFEPFDPDGDHDWHGAYFMACSRARQLLAIVSHAPPAA